MNARRNAYAAEHPEHVQNFWLPPDNISIKPAFGKQRWLFNTGTGKYFQQHKPVREQTIPVGHSVRFMYLEAAVAMLLSHKPDDEMLKTLAKVWEHMVTRRMYVTGGIGSLPNIEGFGRDYELDPEYSYSETCAALGNMLWNWEMTCITGQARYADLFEWQLYNAAAVGLGQDGTSYLYNNPLACTGGLERAAWFKCPCCPSNVSRIWADLGKYIYSYREDEVWLHQYIGSQVKDASGLGIKIETELPWDGKVQIQLQYETARELTLQCRVPSWASGVTLLVNGVALQVEQPPITAHSQTASGYDPRESWYVPVQRAWQPGDMLEIEFEMAINIRSTHQRVKSTLGQVAVSCGPIVYCLESVDNPEVNIFAARLDPGSLQLDRNDDLFGGVNLICGKTTEGKPLTFIPYYLWANRGQSKMTVYVRT